MDATTLNELLAPLVGWEQRSVQVRGRAKLSLRWFGPEGARNRLRPPDFSHDLNAIHVAVMRQPPAVRIEFRNELQYMIAPDTRPRGGGLKVMGAEHYDEWWHAPARLRAEALYEVLRKRKRRGQC